MEKNLYGRELLLSEIPKKLQKAVLAKQVAAEMSASFIKKAGKMHCKRCQSAFTPVPKEACICGEACGYCRQCLKMGKVRLCSQFYHLPEPNQFQLTEKKILAWTGTLSPQQKEASKQIVQTIEQNETRLLWAVTGAGKTEMLFEGIEAALKAKKRICLASPRVDVCLELAPRLRKAFPEIELAVLYGGMEEEYRYTPLVLATTHQLCRFKEAFDVLIIDEIDAFPFRENRALQFAAGKAKKIESSVLILTATPSPGLQKQVQKDKMLATILPARYHGHPLPVPQLIWCANWQTKILKIPLKTAFGQQVAHRLWKQQNFLIFVPNIEWMLKLEERLKKQFPLSHFAAVSAEDPKREEKVQLFRKKQIQFLLSSTILERGVTFPNIDVLVVGAESPVFTEAALVQIAGRAGRSPEFPTGEVLFFHDGKSKAMKKAVRQIKKMNALAKKRGLLR